MTNAPSLESGAPAAATVSWRAELVAVLDRILPTGWHDQVVEADGDVPAFARTLDRRATIAALGADGWIAPHWPLGYCGRGMSAAEAREVAAQLDQWDVPRLPGGSGLHLAAPAILEWGSDETKQRFLPRIATGEERWCQLFSEPGAGSDMASLATTAVREGDSWIVNGQKVWTTLAHKAEFGMLLARTDPDQPKHRGITYFGVDMRSPGVEVRPLVNIAGEVEFNEVFLADVRIPDLHRVSPVGKGWDAALTTLGSERHALAGGAPKRRALDRIMGGKTIDDVIALARSLGLAGDPVWRQRLVQEWTKQRLLALDAQRARGSRSSTGADGSLGKIAKAASNQSLQVLATDLLGARAAAWQVGDVAEGFVREMLRTRANSIEGGTSEIQRNIVGERVLGLPREPDPFKAVAWREVPRSVAR